MRDIDTAGRTTKAYVLGCGCEKKNVCRIHGSAAEMAGQLNEMTSLLTRWVESMPRAQALACDQLVLLQGATPTDEEEAESEAENLTKCTIVLLVHAAYSPKTQFYLRCLLEESDDGSLIYAPPSFPVVVRGQSGVSRMGGSRVVTRLQTSDEFAVDLIKLYREWKVFPLSWEDPVSEYPDSLLHFRILSITDEFVPKNSCNMEGRPNGTCFIGHIYGKLYRAEH